MIHNSCLTILCWQHIWSVSKSPNWKLIWLNAAEPFFNYKSRFNQPYFVTLSITYTLASFVIKLLHFIVFVRYTWWLWNNWVFVQKRWQAFLLEQEVVCFEICARPFSQLLISYWSGASQFACASTGTKQSTELKIRDYRKTCCSSLTDYFLIFSVLPTVWTCPKQKSVGLTQAYKCWRVRMEFV